MTDEGFDYHVNPRGPYTKGNCQNYAEVTDSLTEHTKLGYLYWVKSILACKYTEDAELRHGFDSCLDCMVVIFLHPH